jgi:hypothetical protein
MSKADDTARPHAKSPAAERATIVVRPGAFITAVILSCVAMGIAIYCLLRGMRI